MIRTIFTLGFFTLLGIFALKLVFGILGMAFGLLGVVFWLAVKIAVVGAIAYVALRIVSPNTLRKLRSNSSD
jgi:hypothetical protein